MLLLHIKVLFFFHLQQDASGCISVLNRLKTCRNIMHLLIYTVWRVRDGITSQEKMQNLQNPELVSRVNKCRSVGGIK